MRELPPPPGPPIDLAKDQPHAIETLHVGRGGSRARHRRCDVGSQIDRHHEERLANRDYGPTSERELRALRFEINRQRRDEHGLGETALLFDQRGCKDLIEGEG
jgi:hypothetical protein